MQDYDNTEDKDSYLESFWSQHKHEPRYSGQQGVIMTVRVPREKIFSTALSGNGALIESEVVVMGGKMPAHMVATNDEISEGEFWRKIAPKTGRTVLQRSNQEAVPA